MNSISIQKRILQSNTELLCEYFIDKINAKRKFV